MAKSNVQTIFMFSCRSEVNINERTNAAIEIAILATYNDDIHLEKSEKDEAIELVEKFMPKFDYHLKSSNKSYVIRLNRMKIDSDNFDTRKALSSFCNDIIQNENIN